MAELGFGFLRMAHKDGQIDYENLNEMVDLFMAGGGGRFDTAYTYLDGESETAIGKAVAGMPGVIPIGHFQKVAGMH